MNDARQRAKEWLARYDSSVAAVPAGSVDTPEVRLLRALLAEPARETETETEKLGTLRALLGEEENCGCGPLYCEHVVSVMVAARALTAAEPAPAPDAVREAAEKVSMEWQLAYVNDRLNVPISMAEALAAMTAALDARRRG